MSAKKYGQRLKIGDTLKQIPFEEREKMVANADDILS